MSVYAHDVAQDEPTVADILTFTLVDNAGVPVMPDEAEKLVWEHRREVLLEAADEIGELRLGEREWLPATGLQTAEDALRRMAEGSAS